MALNSSPMCALSVETFTPAVSPILAEWFHRKRRRCVDFAPLVSTVGAVARLLHIL